MEGIGGGGGGTLSEVYRSAQKLLIRTKDELGRIEGLVFTSSSPAYASGGVHVDHIEFSTSIRRDIGHIQSLCAEMDRMWRLIASQGQRGLWKRKVEQLAEEVDSLRKSLDRQLWRHQQQVQQTREREDLLGRANGDSPHVSGIFDEEAQAMQSARNSSMMLEEAYSTGVAILFKYAEQRDRLKRAQRKALDILNTVGLSNTVLKLIERRHRVDKWIAYAGMVVTVVVVYAFWRWTH